MTRMLLNVYDNGLFYVVNNAFVSEEYIQAFTNNVTIIEIRDTMTYGTIVDALVAGKTVKLPKNITTVNPDDLIIDEVSDLVASKNAGVIRIKNSANSRLGNSYTYDFYKFNVLNNILISKGYSITEENKEDKYLEILDTGDDVLISNLQAFLEIQTKISETYNLYTTSEKAIYDIEDATTPEEVDNIVNTYLATLN